MIDVEQIELMKRTDKSMSAHFFVLASVFGILILAVSFIIAFAVYLWMH